MKHSLSHFINFKKTNEFMKKFGFLTLALVSLLFTACDPKEETTDVKVTGLTLNKASIELEIEGTERLTVVKTPSNATTAIVWRSSVDSVASVSSTGIVTALAAGTTTITASADGVSASCTVTVMGAADFSFTQGEIYGWSDYPDFGYVNVYLYTEGINAAEFSGDGFGINLQIMVAQGSGAVIPAGTYTFTDFTTAEDTVPNTVMSGWYNEETSEPVGSYVYFFVENNQEYLDLGYEAGAYLFDPCLAGSTFTVTKADGVYTISGVLTNPAYDAEGNEIEGETATYTFRFKGELPDHTPAAAPAAVKGVKAVRQVNIPWLKK